MPSVQFNNVKDAVYAFDNTECKAWAILDGKHFRFKGIGSQDLQTWLELMNENGSPATVYTLAYYEDITERKSINSKTPFDGSFNFRLLDENSEDPYQGKELNQRGKNLISRMNGLEDKFDLLITKLDGSDIETTKKNNLGIVGDLLGHPQIGPLLTGILSNVATKFLTTDPRPKVENIYQAPRLGQVAGITDNQKELTAYQAGQMELTIERLLKLDPKLPDHLETLALLGEKDPNTFNYILTTLDNMQL